MAFSRCPKCGHQPLPADQSLPAACPGCGAILAKVAQALQAEADGLPRSRRLADEDTDAEAPARLRELLLHVPERVDTTRLWLRAALWLAFAVWGVRLIALDYRTGGMGESFLHAPLLIFHEAGHVVFRLFGHWVGVLGGTLGQLVMPAVLCGALLLKNRDPFGAAIGLWFFGVSVLDVSPYVFDALHPQLTLLSGGVGEEGGHDWIFLLRSMGLLARAQTLGAAIHVLGALVVVLALGWAGWVLKLQHGRTAGDVLFEDD